MKIPFSEVTAHTKEVYKEFTPVQRINFKVNLLRRNYFVITDNNLPLMACASASINQHHYVVSGDCQRGIDRYERENRY